MKRAIKAIRIDDTDRAGNVARFESALSHILTVSKEELAKREKTAGKSTRSTPRRAKKT